MKLKEIYSSTEISPPKKSTNWNGLNLSIDTTYKLASSLSSGNLNNNLDFNNISFLNDITYPNITPSFNGRYTIELYINMNDATLLTNGINLIWTKHISLTLITDSTNLKVMCLPQSYIDNVLNKYSNDISQIYNSAWNKDSWSMTYSSYSWLYIRCAYSKANNSYYLHPNIAKSISINNAHPSIPSSGQVSYYFSNDETTQLILQGHSKNAAIVHVSYINLYTEYLPQPISTFAGHNM